MMNSTPNIVPAIRNVGSMAVETIIKRYRVVVVDDHKSVRMSLAFSLQVFDDLVFVGEAKNSEEAVALCMEIQPDVVLLDLMLPEINGLETTIALRQFVPCAKIIVITGTIGAARLKEQVLQAGASRCLHKSFSIDELALAIRGV